MNKYLLSIAVMALTCPFMRAQAPYGLMTDLIERTDIVYMNGYASSLTLDDLPLAIESVQCAEIATERPRFSWIVDGGSEQDVLQTAWRIEVYTSVSGKKQTVWDSGKVEGGQSSAVEYAGEALKPETVYHWTVTSWTDKSDKGFTSAPKAFRTAPELKPYSVSIEPQVKTDECPASITSLGDGLSFADFGKASFGQLRLSLEADADGRKVTLHLGERVRDGRVERNPFGSCRYRSIELTLKKGRHTYMPKILPDFRNTHGDAVLMPGYIGEVLPFRYLEIEGYDGELRPQDIVRMSVHHPGDDYASDFRCSDDILNQVWNLCKYSMKATSFIGYHIDGDRERIPYELDALVNQLCVYGTDRLYSLSRRSADYLLDHPTWPTEWILQAVLMAWYDYLYTGDDRLLEARYELLGRHTLSSLRCDNGLISTTACSQDAAFLAGIGRNAAIRDIVDWPQGRGGFGLPDSHPGETDYFEFSDYNCVVNAYHCKTLELMAGIAAALGKNEDAARWAEDASAAKRQFNRLLFNSRWHRYVDGVGSDHSALHSNMFPLAFGLVPQKQVGRVADFVEGRGMACSIGNAMFLLDGMYDAFRGDYALSLMTATHDRGWYNTILCGSTMTYEAWDDKYKGNQDWNHAWGGAPASVLPHKTLGVEPLSPAWGRIRIRPQIAPLEYAEGTVPTIKGPVTVRVTKGEGNYKLEAGIPANTKAQVWLPAGPKGMVTVNGVPVSAPKDDTGSFFVLEDIGSGLKTFISE